MKPLRIFAVSFLIAGAFAYGLVALFVWLKINPDLGKMLEGSYPSVAVILFSNPALKDFLIKDHQLFSFFLLVLLLVVPLFFALLQFLWPHLFPAILSPFSTLAALKNRREPEFTALPFVGRSTELTKLDAFAQHPDSFRWWVLGGEPGAGKTRLVWEWARTLKGWDVKVLNSKIDPEALQRWRPRRRTLILVDEFATRQEDITHLAAALQTRDKPLRKPVRLLLVDWAIPGWLETEPVRLPLEQREGEPLVCADWSRDAFHEALPQLWPKHLPLPDDAKEERLFEASAGNPLALIRWLTHPDSPMQAKRRLFRAWAKEVREGLLKKGLREDYLPLAALAAWCGGYPWQRVDATRLGYPGKTPDLFDRRDLSALPNPPGRKGTIPAFTPETLAVEYALAELLNHGETYRHWLRRLAWEANAQGASRSLWRLHRLDLQGGLDEEEREILAFLDSSPVEAGCLEEMQAEALLAWETMRAGLLVEAEERRRQAGQLEYIVHDHGKRGELELMATKFLELRALAEAWLGDMGVKVAFAACLKCTATHYGEFDQRQAILAAIDELRVLAQTHPCEAKIQSALASGLANLVGSYGYHGDWKAMESDLDELRNLAHLDGMEIHLVLARGLYNAAINYGNANDRKAKESVLDELRTLAQTHPGEAEIQLHLSRGLVHSTIYNVQHDDRKALVLALVELHNLVQAHPGGAEILLCLAMGLYNAVLYYLEHGDLNAMTSALNALRSLAKVHTGKAEIQLQMARGLFNAAYNYGKHDDWKAMESALGELCSLACSRPGEAEIQLLMAQGLFNAAYNYGKLGDLQAMASALDELRTLAYSHSAEAEIQLPLAMGLHNQAIYDPEHASSAIVELKTLAWRFPTHDGIQERAHQHGVSYAQQEIAKREALERQARALLDARRP